MKQEVSRPALIALIVAAVVLVIGAGWFFVNRDAGAVVIRADKKPGEGRQPLGTAGGPPAGGAASRTNSTAGTAE